MDYDDFGNRTEAQWQSSACTAPAAGKAAPSPTATYNASNQVTNNGYQYDKAGNVIYDGVSYYAYDNDGRLCAVQTRPATGGTVAYGYLYDAEGRRVAKGTVAVSSTTPLSAATMCNPASNGYVLT